MKVCLVVGVSLCVAAGVVARSFADAMTTMMGKTGSWTIAREVVNLVFASPDENEEVTPSAGIKVIAAGPGRTGTSSLSDALEILGYRPYHMIDNVIHGHSEIWQRALRTGSVHEAVDAVLALGYDAILDEPGTAFVPQLAEMFPEAKIILTHRNVTSWVQSVKNFALLHEHIAKPPFIYIPALKIFTKLAKTIFRLRGCSVENMLADDVDGTCTEWYYQHMDQMKTLFADQEEGRRFLTYHVKEGWEPLVSFLGFEDVPSAPFPRANGGDEVTKVVAAMEKLSMVFSLIPTLLIVAFFWMLRPEGKTRKNSKINDGKIPRIRGMSAVIPGVDGTPGGNVPTSLICRVLRSQGVHNPKNGKVISDDFVKRNLHIPSVALGNIDNVRSAFEPTEDEVPSSLTSITEEEMAYRAFDEALRKAQVNIEDLDALLYVSCTAQDVHFNEGVRHWYSRYPKLSKRLKFLFLPHGCPAYLLALELGKTMLNSADVSNLAIVISSSPSRFYTPDCLKAHTAENDMNLWLNFCVFGDGAFSCILSSSLDNMPSRTYKLLAVDIVCNPDVFISDRKAVSTGKSVEQVFVLNPEGPKEIPNSLRYWFSYLKKAYGYSISSFQHIVFHQANPKVIGMVCDRFGCADKTSMVGEKYGNLGPASVGCALHDRLEKSLDKPKDGELVMGYALGALTGLSHGIFVLECEVRK